MDPIQTGVKENLLARRLGVSLLVYASLIFSSALQFTLGPESVVRVDGFYTADRNSRDANFLRAHPDFGILSQDADARRALKKGADWTFASFWADAAYYVAQVSSLDDSMAPYKYRFLPTLVVRSIVAVSGLQIEHAFIVFNVIASLLTALLFETFLLRFFELRAITALLGGCLFTTSASNTGTLGFPMLEPASALFSCLIVWSVAYEKVALFILVSVLGVVTKEVLVISGLLWMLVHAKREVRSLVKHLCIASAPLLAFVTARVVLGGAPLEVNYGYDVLHGDFPTYGRRIFGLRSLAGVALQVFLSFSFLWLGLCAAPRNPFLKRCLPIVPITILSAILLSGRLTRVLGILFPIVIPSGLIWLEAKFENKAKQNV
jgi:hypothetical protein